MGVATVGGFANENNPSALGRAYAHGARPDRSHSGCRPDRQLPSLVRPLQPRRSQLRLYLQRAMHVDGARQRRLPGQPGLSATGLKRQRRPPAAIATARLELRATVSAASRRRDRHRLGALRASGPLRRRSVADASCRVFAEPDGRVDRRHPVQRIAARQGEMDAGGPEPRGAVPANAGMGEIPRLEASARVALPPWPGCIGARKPLRHRLVLVGPSMQPTHFLQLGPISACSIRLGPSVPVGPSIFSTHTRRPAERRAKTSGTNWDRDQPTRSTPESRF